MKPNNTQPHCGTEGLEREHLELIERQRDSGSAGATWPCCLRWKMRDRSSWNDACLYSGRFGFTGITFVLYFSGEPRITGIEEDTERKWETATGLLPKYMKAVEMLEETIPQYDDHKAVAGRKSKLYLDHGRL